MVTPVSSLPLREAGLATLATFFDLFFLALFSCKTACFSCAEKCFVFLHFFLQGRSWKEVLLFVEKEPFSVDLQLVSSGSELSNRESSELLCDEVDSSEGTSEALDSSVRSCALSWLVF